MKKFLIGLGIVVLALMGGVWSYIPTAVDTAVQKTMAKLQAKGYQITATTTVKRDGFALYPTITVHDIAITNPNKTVQITLGDAVVHLDGLLHMTITLDGHNGTTTAPVVKRIGSATFESIDVMATVDGMAMVMGKDIKPLSHIESMIENITFANRAYGQTGLQDIRLSATVYGQKLPVLENLGADGVKLTDYWALSGGYIAVQSLAFNGKKLDEKTPPMLARYKGRVQLQNGLSTRGMLEASPFSSLLDILVKWKKIPKKVVPYTDLVMLLLGGKVQGDILTIPLSFDESRLRVGKLEF